MVAVPRKKTKTSNEPKTLWWHKLSYQCAVKQKTSVHICACHCVC